ncbi:hypothetical protein H4Q26_008681 [Puccinia striiformis f. sp. tritici PST-130]|nr:hypothetical protein H4Q26_008681 [Puccinia striiformis f. sp. tritici PST-130]
MSSLCSTTSGRTLRVLLLVATTDMKVFTPIFASSAVENFTSSFYAILCPLSAISATGIVPRPGLWEEQSNHFPFSDDSSVATSSLAPTELDGIWKTTQSQANLPLEPAYEPIVQSPGVKVSEGYQTDPLIRRVVSSSPEGIPMTDQPTHTRKRKYNHGPLCINEPIVHSTFPSPFQSVDHCYPVPHDGIYLGQASSRGGFHAGNSNIAPHQIFGTGSASSQSSDFVPGVTPQTAGRSHVNPVDSLTLDTHNFDWSHLDAFLSNDFVSELHQCDEYHIPSKKPRIASGHVDVDCPSNRLLFHSQLPIAIYLGEHGDSQVTLNVLSRSGLTLKALDTLETQLKALTEWIVGFHVQNARNVNLSRANHRINLKPFFTWLKNQIFTPEVGFPVMGVFQSPWHGWEEQFQNYKFHETQLRLLEYFSDDKDPSSLGTAPDCCAFQLDRLLPCPAVNRVHQQDPTTRTTTPTNPGSIHQGNTANSTSPLAHPDAMSKMSSSPIVIDGKGHLLGRLASIIAKQAISGQKVVVLRWADHMHKRHLVNPKKSGPFHHRAPSRILYKAIRGMMPHKTARGAAGLQRIKLFEGMPPPYDRKKKMVVPQALRVLRLKPGRKWCTIKRLSHEYGWGYKDVVDTLEAKRKVKAQAFHERKVALLKARKQVAADPATETVQTKLSALGY